MEQYRGCDNRGISVCDRETMRPITILFFWDTDLRTHVKACSVATIIRVIRGQSCRNKPFCLGYMKKRKIYVSTWSIRHFYSLWTVLKSIMQVAESLYGLLSTSLSALKCFSVCKWVKLYKVDYVDWDVGCWMLSRPRVGLQVTSLMGDSRERKLEQGGTRSVW